jgi:hypothetical protein
MKDNDKHILENIGQWDFILLRLIPIKPITQVFKVSTHILTSITARYIGLSAIQNIVDSFISAAQLQTRDRFTLMFYGMNYTHY